MLANEVPCGVDRDAGPRVTRVSGSSLRPGMEVYRADGEAVGRVTAVGEDDFLLKRRWLGHVQVPLDRVLAVIADRVLLTERPGGSSRYGR